MVQTDRWTWMSLAAATLAVQDAGYTAPEDAYATSVFLASGSGGNEFSQHEIQGLWAKGPRSVGAYQSIAWFYAASTGQVSIRDGWKGPSGVVVSEGAGGLDSIGWARRVARRGTPAVLTGGTEAGICPYALLCQTTSGRLTTATRPEEAYRPFDRQADGAVVGEGGADGAQRRARIAHVLDAVEGTDEVVRRQRRELMSGRGEPVHVAQTSCRRHAARSLDEAGVRLDGEEARAGKRGGHRQRRITPAARHVGDVDAAGQSLVKPGHRSQRCQHR
jgi:minimal PKS chain-length factor (CLF/KS beta)